MLLLVLQTFDQSKFNRCMKFYTEDRNPLITKTCLQQDIHPWQTSALLVFLSEVVQNNTRFYFNLILNNLNITRATEHVLHDMM
jgi:hypothetical protein